jgi:hypothetical protein
MNSEGEDSQEIKFDDYFKLEKGEEDDEYSIQDSNHELSLSKSPGTLISKKSTPATTQ